MLTLYDESKPFRFHIELTDGCNARCPHCPRNLIEHTTKTLKAHPNLAGNDITFQQYKDIFKNYLNKTASVVFSGNFGDPVWNPEFSSILEYTVNNVLSENNSYVKVCTNGGFRKPEWWTDLARKTKSKPLMCFAIDGLEDTHHLYRVNTRYDRVIANAKAWIAEGGKAEWQFIRMDHNKHQEAEAKRRANELGFTSFQVVVSNRGSIEEFNYKGIKYHITAPEETNIEELPYTTVVKKQLKKLKENKGLHFGTNKDSDGMHQIIYEDVIDCQEAEINRIYIDCEGFVYPCCWIGSHQYHVRNSTRTMYDTGNILFTKNAREMDKAWNRSFIDILQDAWFEFILPTSWDNEPCSICSQNCGKRKTQTIRTSEHYGTN